MNPLLITQLPSNSLHYRKPYNGIKAQNSLSKIPWRSQVQGYLHNCYKEIRSLTLNSYPCDHVKTRSFNVLVPLTSIHMFTQSITILTACENYCLIQSMSITCASLSVLTMSRLVNIMTNDSLSINTFAFNKNLKS